ncbi:MAG: hypothetical protein R3C58_14165 [Parvularculaceae bacterium]
MLARNSHAVRIKTCFGRRCNGAEKLFDRGNHWLEVGRIVFGVAFGCSDAGLAPAAKRGDAPAVNALHAAPARDSMANGVWAQLDREARRATRNAPAAPDVLNRPALVGHKPARRDRFDPCARKARHRHNRTPFFVLRATWRIEIDEAALKVALESGQLKERALAGAGRDREDEEHLEMRLVKLVPERGEFVRARHIFAGRAVFQFQFRRQPVELFLLDRPIEGRERRRKQPLDVAVGKSLFLHFTRDALLLGDAKFRDAQIAGIAAHDFERAALRDGAALAEVLYMLDAIHLHDFPESKIFGVLRFDRSMFMHPGDQPPLGFLEIAS